MRLMSFVFAVLWANRQRVVVWICCCYVLTYGYLTVEIGWKIKVAAKMPSLSTSQWPKGVVSMK
jgi:hypothetical protein